MNTELETDDVDVENSYEATKQAINMLEKMTSAEYKEWNERELKRQKYANPKPEYAGGPTYYDENTQIWDD